MITVIYYPPAPRREIITGRGKVFAGSLLTALVFAAICAALVVFG